MRQRVIIHVDMDAFFAAVEQRDNPELKGKPVIVGGVPGERGVVAAASYEARKFGVRSAMSLWEAARLCPHGIFIPGNHKKYQEVSEKIFRIFREYTPLVEPVSLDEAYLDVTGSQKLFGPGVEIGKKIKKRIFEETELTASVGVAPNKFLAKLASEVNKPDGFCEVTEDNILDFLAPLPVEMLWGVGEKMKERLNDMGIKTVQDFWELPEFFLRKKFGVLGQNLYYLSRGIDFREVIPERVPKSLGKEITLQKDSSDVDYLLGTLLGLTMAVGRGLRREGFYAGGISVKIRLSSFITYTRHTMFFEPTWMDEVLYREAKRLFLENYHGELPVRLIGVTATPLIPVESGRQISLFGEDPRRENLYPIIDRLNHKYGNKTVTRAKILKISGRG
ncbi:DNA polymerase IV [Carboxydothermus islandicus]|uniref:DNA polymerase IV n=1 Tax=Carboxydothermus islandicus TaxID=661089 RepID=A0A1L8D121_9THEO|nr:DNA polymerase IV [Carboxydothermus islandicus]GAV24858.1 DNA polymerase IV [Carboxydothermus islandicus]